MIWRVIKKSAIDTWDELLYAIIFNLIWLVGTLLLVPWPFVTFALFYIAKDIGDGKGIKFGNFFRYGRDNWKAAYIWGGINLAVLVVLWLNLNFYAGVDALWARLIQILFIAIIIFWSVLQLIVLALYPRLVESNFRLALRNAGVIVARYPLLPMVLIVTVVAMIGIVLLLNAIIFLLPFVFIAIVTNNLVGVVVNQELERREGSGD